MVTFLKGYENQLYALMRITTGFMFLCHGAMKFMNVAEAARPWHIQWIAAPIELIGGALVMLGLFTFCCHAGHIAWSPACLYS
jgi:putative oxidoreductase